MNDPLDFNQIQAKRLAAQMAFLKADSGARLRRAMQQNFKRTKHRIVVGQMCYWRIQRSNPSFRTSGVDVPVVWRRRTMRANNGRSLVVPYSSGARLTKFDCGYPESASGY